MALTCPRCQAALTPGDRFCAECGGRIAPPEPPGEGGSALAIGPGLAARTDPGLRHRSNQDAFALSGPVEGGAGAILVVCDGVSNSQTPELASTTAAQVAHDALARGAAMADAIRAAHEAVCALPFDRQAELDPPATTIVAAVLDAAGATLGWLGDSRAYRLGIQSALLTRDHSWWVDAVERGMSEAEANRDPRAHALLHCLGATDFARASPCPEPAIRVIPAGAGWLMLCSDGLWNYAPAAATLTHEAGGDLAGDGAALCARLVAFARDAGGHDNITVAAVRWPVGQRLQVDSGGGSDKDRGMDQVTP